MDLMNRVFLNYLHLFVFIDDILAYSKNEDEHMDHLRVVLQIHKKYQPFVMYIKGEFLLTSVAFHGYIISI